MFNGTDKQRQYCKSEHVLCTYVATLAHFISFTEDKAIFTQENEKINYPPFFQRYEKCFTHKVILMDNWTLAARMKSIKDIFSNRRSATKLVETLW